jgi:hypothetical protein
MIKSISFNSFFKSNFNEQIFHFISLNKNKPINQTTFKWVSRFMAAFEIAYVGFIYCKLYLSGFSKESAAKPKNVWKTSTVFPGRSPIPPYSSWQWRM